MKTSKMILELQIKYQDNVNFFEALNERFGYCISLMPYDNAHKVVVEDITLYCLDDHNAIRFLETYGNIIYLTYVKNMLNEHVNRLNKQNTFLKRILDLNPDMIAFKDNQNVYRYANKSALNVFDLAGKKLIDQHVTDVYPKEVADRIIKHDNETIEKNGLAKEMDMYVPDGTLQIESLRIPIYDNSTYEGILTINKNITDKKNIESKLSKVSAFQDILIQIATVFMNVPEEKTNDAINDALGMVGSHIKADRVYVFDYLFDLNIMNNTHEWVSNGIIPFIDELQNVPIELFLDDWVNPHRRGEVIYIPDVSKMDQTSDLYATLSSQGIQSLLTIPLLFQDVLMGFVGFDAVNNITNWSEDDQNLLKVLAELIVNLKRKQLQHNLLIQEKQYAEKASNAKSEFLANMSHEIRTPLSGIYNSHYLLYNTDLTDEQIEYLDIAKSSIESLSSIVNNILDLSKIEAGKLELELGSFDLEKETYQIFKMQEYSAIEKGLKIFFEFDYHITNEVISDRLRIRQVLLNLLSNAIKYTEKGEVKLVIKLIDETKSHYNIQFHVSDSGVGIPRKVLNKITDKFFQVDASSTKKYQGTGLGLSIVKSLVELFGGQLDIETELNVGSIFSFNLNLAKGSDNIEKRLNAFRASNFALINSNVDYLDASISFFQSISDNLQIISSDNEDVKPKFNYIIVQKPLSEISQSYVKELKLKYGDRNTKIIQCTLEQVQATNDELVLHGIDFTFGMPTTREKVYDSMLASKRYLSDEQSFSQLNAVNPKHVTVMIVDDNKVNRIALSRILEKHGLKVITATSGFQAIEMIKNLNVNLILMDIQMPEMDGYETTKIIRDLGYEATKLPIIALTANALTSIKTDVIEAGMNDYLTKPIKPESLFSLLDRYLTSSNTHLVPSHLLHFNHEQVIYDFEDDLTFLLSVIETFIDDIKDVRLRLKSAYEQNNDKQFEQVVHYLKGSAAYLCLEQLTYLSTYIMDTYKQSKASVLSFYDTYMQVITETEHAIKKWMVTL